MNRRDADLSIDQHTAATASRAWGWVFAFQCFVVAAAIAGIVFAVITGNALGAAVSGAAFGTVSMQAAQNYGRWRRV